MALLRMKVSRHARQETSDLLPRPPILLLEQRTPTWVVWLGAAVAGSGARTHSGSKHLSGVRVVTKFVDIDWKEGIFAFRAFLGLHVFSVRCVSAGYPLGASHQSCFLRVYVFESFDIHLYEGLVGLFCQGSNVQKVSHGRFNTGKGRFG